MNATQNISILASPEDGIYYHHDRNEAVDIDALYQINVIKEIIHDDEDKCFYLLVNKHLGKLGFFLIRIDDDNPENFDFFLKY